MIEIPERIIKEARRPEYKLLHVSRDGLIPILCDGEVAGFHRMRECAYGRRIGPLFIHPDYRRRGLALAVYASIDGPLVACIRHDNEPSRCLHERAGFKPWRRFRYGLWWRRP